MTETKKTASKTCRVVTFQLEEDNFAVAAENVSEILDLVPITRVPTAKAYAAGLINVRGAVVPLADLRVIFGMKQRPTTSDTRILVIEVDMDGEAVIAGLLADKVNDVKEIDISGFESAPDVGVRWPAEYITGIGMLDEELMFVPDISKIFSHNSPRTAKNTSSQERVEA